MRKLTAILFLAITVFGYAGYQFFYAFQIEAAKERAATQLMRQISADHLIKIASGKILRWESDEEFWYAGELYDLVRKEYQGGCEYLLCMPDKAEAAAVKALENAGDAGQASGATGEKTPVKIKNTLQDLFCSQHSQVSEDILVCNKACFANFYTVRLSACSLTILKPPPKMLVTFSESFTS